MRIDLQAKHNKATQQKAICKATKKHAAEKCRTANLLKTIIPTEQIHQLPTLSRISEDSLSGRTQAEAPTGDWYQSVEDAEGVAAIAEWSQLPSWQLNWQS